MIQFFLQNPIIAALIWAVLYAFDFGITGWFSQYYRNTLSRNFTYEGGVELNPVFEKSVAKPDGINRRFLFFGIFMVGLLVFFGSIIPEMVNFEFMLGAFLLLWLFIDLRHFRNSYLYLCLKDKPEALTGHIQQTYWLSQRMVSFDAFAFGFVYYVGWVFSGREFFAGGAFICFLLTVRHFLLADRVAMRQDAKSPIAGRVKIS